VVKALCYKSEGRWFDPSWCQWNFSLTKSFRSHYGPGVDSASNRNEYQEYFLGVKAVGARRLHNEELNDLYSSSNIVRVIKSRRMRWAGHVACMGEERGCIWSWWGNRREGDHWGDLGVDGWILGWVSRRWDVVYGLDWAGPG